MEEAEETILGRADIVVNTAAGTVKFEDISFFTVQNDGSLRVDVIDDAKLYKRIGYAPGFWLWYTLTGDK